jgi:hypothetical protein
MPVNYICILSEIRNCVIFDRLKLRGYVKPINVTKRRSVVVQINVTL